MNPTPQPNTPPAQPQIKPVSLVFIGPIQNPATKNLRNACCGAVNNGTKEIQIFFSSSGGLVDEGFALYAFLRALPVKLTMHAIGFVDSMALPVFLAAENRLCSPDSTFLFHDFQWGTTAAISQTRTQWGELHAILEQSALRTKELLKLRTTLTDEDFKIFEFHKKTQIQRAAFAKEKGIVQEIKEAFIPVGGPVFNIDF